MLRTIEGVAGKLFSDMSPRAIEALAMKLNQQYYLKEDVLCHQNALETHMFFLKRGVVRLSVMKRKRKSESSPSEGVQAPPRLFGFGSNTFKKLVSTSSDCVSTPSQLASFSHSSCGRLDRSPPTPSDDGD
eukprot:7380091-Prymnesium_polylepis.2